MSIVLGTYIDGRPLVYIEATHRFMIGQATVSAAAVRSYDQCGRIRWGQAAQQAWFYQVGAQVFDMAATQQAAAEHTLSSVGGAAQRASNRQPEPAAQQAPAPQHRPSVQRAPVPQPESITRPAFSEQDVPPQVPDPSHVPGAANTAGLNWGAGTGEATAYGRQTSAVPTQGAAPCPSYQRPPADVSTQGGWGRPGYQVPPATWSQPAPHAAPRAKSKRRTVILVVLIVIALVVAAVLLGIASGNFFYQQLTSGSGSSALFSGDESYLT